MDIQHNKQKKNKTQIWLQQQMTTAELQAVDFEETQTECGGVKLIWRHQPVYGTVSLVFPGVRAVFFCLQTRTRPSVTCCIYQLSTKESGARSSSSNQAALYVLSIAVFDVDQKTWDVLLLSLTPVLLILTGSRTGQLRLSNWTM